MTIFKGLPYDPIKIQACSCDANLTNITLPQGWIIEGHEGGLAAKPPTGDAEGLIAIPGIAQVGINYTLSPIDDGEPLKDIEQKISAKLSSLNDPQTTIKVAVFDTGLDPAYVTSNLSDMETSLCKPDNDSLDNDKSTTGWNFVADRTEPTDASDNSEVKHGSRVAYMLAKQFIGSRVAPQIIPMRVLGKDKKGDLFGLMCAMETARKNGIKVFNMSLGYYGPADSTFAEYIERALADNVWIVVAAGNRTQEEPANVDRDLKTMQPEFYPAAFAKNSNYANYEKLLVATTVLINNDGNVITSTRQNYGKDFVLGIMADDVNPTNEGRLSIVAPDNQDQQSLLIFGTSYATPVLTGRLALLLAGNPNASLNDLLNQMETGPSGSQVKRYFPSHPPRPQP